MNENVIDIRDLTVFYGTQRGILNLNLSVKRSEVFGFLGPNGAGKTTTQRVLLDVIHPTRGQALIFGLDSQKEGTAIRSRVGYLPGEFRPYLNMRGGQFLDLLASLQRSSVVDSYRRELCERLELNLSRKLKHYSHGNKQKIGIVAAFMGRPELLILDEPTIGLDPLAQQTVLELVRDARNKGRTVFFSSHNLTEVQAVCDRVGIIREGELVKTEHVETLIDQRFKRLQLTLRQSPPPDAFNGEGTTETGRDGNQVILETRQDLDVVLEKALSYGIEDIETLPVTLEDIFLAYYDRDNSGGSHA